MQNVIVSKRGIPLPTDKWFVVALSLFYRAIRGRNRRGVKDLWQTL